MAGPLFNIVGDPGDPGAPGAPGDPGDAGANGSTILDGAVDPSDTDGNNGDFYLQTADGVHGLKGDFWKKTAGTWGVPA